MVYVKCYNQYIPIVKPYVDYYFYLKGILENETKVLNDKSFASSINNYKEDFFESYENLNEIEAQVCSNLASSFCSNIYIDLKYQEEYFSEQIPETNDRDFIIKFIESKAKGFKKIKNKCPEYLLNVCENYMLSLLKWEKDGVYTETDDSWFNVRNYFAHTFKEQICQLGIRFVSKEDVKKKTMDFWNDILDNKDSLIKFKKKTIGSLFEIVSQIKWNHTLLRIVKDYNNGVLSVDNYYCRIDLVEWGLIDYVDSDSKNGDDDTEIFIQDDSTEFEKKHFVSNGNKIENWNSPKSNEFLSDDDLKIVFDILDNLKITSENIYILDPERSLQ
ncbi:MAG: hypothetical protein IPO37_21995 [Saprospiraceae bacterium]|nr:hypothetical protein [Saprospiraceae bacterium]